MPAASDPSVLDTDIAIIGGGMAGASAAAALAVSARVVLIERESVCGYHSTGRSAASFTENYGTAVIRRLAMASRAFLEAPPPGFCESPLMSPRGMLTIARADQLAGLEAGLAAARALVPSIVAITPQEAVERVPVLRGDYVAGAILEPDSRDIDVNTLHQGFLRAARRLGAVILTDAGVSAIARQGGRFQIATPRGMVVAPILVNAAGAWADAIATLAGAAPLGLVPKRRTAFHVPAPAGASIAGWPFVNDADEAFYFRPDAGRLLVSPGDATPSPPTDAQPEELDIAIAIDRLQRATTIAVAGVPHRWAGLRTFASDGSPVVGFDERVDGFFWLAGQGGYGIKTAPALSQVTAALIRGDALPDGVRRTGLDAADLAPARLAATASSNFPSNQAGTPS